MASSQNSTPVGNDPNRPQSGGHAIGASAVSSRRLLETLAQRGEIFDRLALAGDQRLQLMIARPAGEQLLGKLTLRDRGLSLDPHLAAKRRPVEDGRDAPGCGAARRPCGSTAPW